MHGTGKGVREALKRRPVKPRPPPPNCTIGPREGKLKKVLKRKVEGFIPYLTVGK